MRLSSVQWTGRVIVHADHSENIGIYSRTISQGLRWQAVRRLCGQVVRLPTRQPQPRIQAVMYDMSMCAQRNKRIRTRRSEGPLASVYQPSKQLGPS